jgi:hypothetical protein
MKKAEIMEALAQGAWVIKTFHIHHTSAMIETQLGGHRITNGQLDRLVKDRIIEFDYSTHGAMTRHYFRKKNF